jgi:hypothetical protein
VISDTELRDVRTHFSHYPRNLMTKHRRGWNDIVSSKKQVGVAQTRGLHVDQDFASHRRSDVNVLEIEASTECVEYKRLHLWPPYSSAQTDLVFQAAGASALPGSRFAVLPASAWPSVSSAFRFREFDKDYLIRPRHLYYQTNRDKLSEWSCGI